jgi:uncharacterized phage protein gp47/JayE
MPIVVPDLSTTSKSVASAISTRLPGADSTPPRSVLGVLAKVLSGGVDGLYGAIQTVAAEIIYDTASGDYLARWAAIWGLARQAPVPATGTVVFTGNNVTVPQGTVLARADGLQYILAAAVTLIGGAGSGTVTCASAGAVTNTAAGGTLGLTSPVAGVASTVTVGSGGLSAGADLEGDESLLARLLLRIQQTPQGGSAADYEEWALGVNGVTRAWIYQGWQGAGTVGVTFMMDKRSNPVPQTADVAAVQAAINAVRPVAAPTFVFAPTPVPLNFTIHLNPSSTAVQAAVTAQLSSLIANQCTPGGTSLINGQPVAGGLLYLSHIWAAISAAAGEVDFTLIGPTANVTVPSGSITTMGTVSWV